MFFIGSCLEYEITIREKVTLDCIHQSASGSVSSYINVMESNIQTDQYLPFTSELTVCGITPISIDDVSDVFMMRVGRTIGEMFSTHEEKIR